MTQLHTMMIFGFCGLCAFVRGAWILSPALGWMTVGAACLFLALWPVIRERILR